MTLSLINSIRTLKNHSKLIIYKCLLAKILINIPIKKDEQFKLEVIERIWSIMKNTIYNGYQII